VLGKRSLGVYWLLMPLVLFADLFVSWLGIHGYRDFFEDSSHRPDMIVSNNGSIVGIVFLLSFSLFCSLTITRFTICYLYARRHAPDIEKEWPLRGVPQVDPTPEIELWQPEKKD
jgi:hypothetical protein